MNNATFLLALPSDLKSAASKAAENRGVSLACYFRRAVKLTMARDLENEEHSAVRNPYQFML